jgi:hypothetical protein
MNSYCYFREEMWWLNMERNSVLKIGPDIKPGECWFTGLMVELLGHWSNRITKPDKTG